MLKTLTIACLATTWACSNANTGTTATAVVVSPDVTGTVFTIVFENEDAANVISAQNPYFNQLATQYAHPLAYTSSTHPSLPNYVMMTSGSLNGITTDADPAYNTTLPGSDNIADQLDAANIPWRAYMESMGSPCSADSTDLYSAHHNPFLYYWSIRMNQARCAQKIVDFDVSFAADLAANTYRYMWITPNMCNDAHNCPVQTADAWLARVVPQIMASPGYQAGGVIFILFDEGNSRLPGASAELPVIVVSPNLAQVTPSTTAFDHRSYLATVEDIFSLPRLATTQAVTSMGELFRPR